VLEGIVNWFPLVIPWGRFQVHIVVLASFSIHPDDWAQASGRNNSVHFEAILNVYLEAWRRRVRPAIAVWFTTLAAQCTSIDRGDGMDTAGGDIAPAPRR
jgi:hypothetical protein